MEFFTYRQGELYCEEVPVQSLVKKFGTPLYIYSSQGFIQNFQRAKEAFASLSPRVCYSVKANSHLAILDLLRRQGAFFDVVSIGELKRVERAGGSASHAVFAGVGKEEADLWEALEKGIFFITLESLEEARLLHQVAEKLERPAPVLFRLNPDVLAPTHKYISTGAWEHKFGISEERLKTFLEEEMENLPYLLPKGIHIHIGSQIQTPESYQKAIERVQSFLSSLSTTWEWEFFDLGGGFGVDYEKVKGTNWDLFSKILLPSLEGLNLNLLLEPGRSIAALAGILVTKVIRRKMGKNKIFWIVDSGMHHLIRPALYGALHRIWPVVAEKTWEDEEGDEEGDVVGPICETGDFLGRGCKLPGQVNTGDLLAVFGCGAYGMSMASHYNSHLMPAEVMVQGREFYLISPRESYEDLWKREILISPDFSSPHLE